MNWFQMLLCLSALCGNSQQLLLPPDPCNPTNHMELDEPHRSAHFKIGDPETPLCDNQLDEGWYRFTSQAGGTIPTTCQQNYQCGTVGPVWMNGTLPQESEGEVERTVCVNLLSSDDHCCEKSREIKVRNCGNFYVYYLYPTPDCPVSYCAGDITPCPANKWSPTLFPPCKDVFPIIKTPPTLPGPIIINDRIFHFVCQINFTDNDPEQRFEVSWLFDGKEDPSLSLEILSDPSRDVILDGSKLAGHLNQNIECQVRSYYTGNQAHKSGYLRSNAYYAGVQASPARLEYEAQDSLKSIILTSTVPIVCDSSYKCCLQFLVDENGSDDVVIATKCIYELCTKDWDYKNSSASVEIKIVAKTMGFVQDVSDKQLLLSFEELLPDGGPYTDIFSSTGRLNDVQITLESRTSYTVCSATGGLHFTSFDGRKYNLYFLGDFTAVQVLRRNFEVQIRTWVCNVRHVPPGACICGITVREENDLVRIDQCDQVFGGRTTSPKITTPRPLQEGTIILRSVDSKQIGVYLRSGAQIRLETVSTMIYMYITLPSTDKDSATGICGTNDGNENNEFTYPDGHVGSDCKDCSTSSDYRCCTPTDFMQAWRADTDNRPSLFMTIPDPLNMTTDTRYCSCQKDDIVCDVRGNAPVDGNACTNQCTLAPPEITDDPWAFGKRGLRYEYTDEPDVA